MTREDLKSEIDYIRTVAEAGQDAPLVGGWFAIWWGGLAGLTMITHWAIWTDRAPVGPDMLLPLWIGFMVLGSLGSALLGMTVRGKPGVGSVGNRVSSIVWRTAGFVTFAYFAGITAGALADRLDPVFFNSILPVALLNYAFCWLVIGGITRRRTWTATGVVTLIGAVICTLLVTTAEVYLVAAITILLTNIPQGVAMVRQEPASVV
jgi:hypothetical protein